MYDPTDERGVPVSAGVPSIVILSAFIGLIVIFALAAMVFLSSGHGHAWPSSSAVSVPLS